MSNKEVTFVGDILVYIVDGLEHREDGPAKIWPDGYCEWYLYGKLHREDGPAFYGGCSRDSYYIHGEYMNEQEFIKWKLLNFLK